jgi:hypothetical protein
VLVHLFALVPGAALAPRSLSCRCRSVPSRPPECSGTPARPPPSRRQYRPRMSSTVMLPGGCPRGVQRRQPTVRLTKGRVSTRLADPAAPDSRTRGQHATAGNAGHRRSADPGTNAGQTLVLIARRSARARADATSSWRLVAGHRDGRDDQDRRVPMGADASARTDCDRGEGANSCHLT